MARGLMHRTDTGFLIVPRDDFAQGARAGPHDSPKRIDVLEGRGCSWEIGGETD
jgi:hypothetical protein